MSNPYSFGKFGEFPAYDKNDAVAAMSKYKDDPTQENLNAAVSENIRLAAWFTYYFLDRKRLAYLTDDEIYSICCTAIDLAVRRFDPDRGVQFSTFATRIMLHSVVSANLKETAYHKHFNTSEDSSDVIYLHPDKSEDTRETIDVDDAIKLIDGWVRTNLNKRDKLVYRCRKNGDSTASIAKKLGVTRQRVKQIHDRIIRTLRKQFAFLLPAGVDEQ